MSAAAESRCDAIREELAMPGTAAAGFFGPSSLAWRIHREGALLLGGPRALLLQLAHPLVAAGVADHSGFERDPLGRLERTLEVTLGIVFGDRAHARACSERLNEVHRSVHGVLRDATATFRAGTPYHALDPPLLLWVHATLVDSALRTYQLLVCPLSLEERRRFYQESKLMGRLVGVPASQLPADLHAFRRYFRTMLASRELEITPTARRLARAVLRPPRPLWLRSLSALTTLIAAGLLPPRLREAYALPWRARERHAWRGLLGVVRLGLPFTPERARCFAEAWRAEKRLAAAGA